MQLGATKAIQTTILSFGGAYLLPTNCNSSSGPLPMSTDVLVLRSIISTIGLPTVAKQDLSREPGRTSVLQSLIMLDIYWITRINRVFSQRLLRSEIQRASWVAQEAEKQTSKAGL